jgi:polysaccharide export outer membrane protein
MRKGELVIKVVMGFIISIAFFTSCVPMKKQIYLQSAADSAKVEFINPKLMDYTLKPGNNLYIQVISIDEDVSAFFNLGMSSSGNIYYDAAIYLNSYAVNDSGFIVLPFIGNVKVSGLTIEEAKEAILKKISIYLDEITVIVKLVNFKVTVVGEVLRPAQFTIYQDQINVFEILSLAGDMTTFAKRDDVVLVRKTKNGSKMHHLNLLSDDFLESEYFYIMPDDIIYVKPVKGRNFAFTSFPYTLVISSISLILALTAIFK